MLFFATEESTIRIYEYTINADPQKDASVQAMHVDIFADNCGYFWTDDQILESTMGTFKLKPTLYTKGWSKVQKDGADILHLQIFTCGQLLTNCRSGVMQSLSVCKHAIFIFCIYKVGWANIIWNSKCSEEKQFVMLALCRN